MDKEGYDDGTFNVHFGKLKPSEASRNLEIAKAVPFSETNVQLKEYEFAAGYCVEFYDDPTKYEKGTQDENYYCEIWIPVKKKA